MGIGVAKVMTDEAPRIRTQAVGAYGEKAAEAELLRYGWMKANVNTSIKNAEDFDIFAHKGDRRLDIRVKTSGPGTNAFFNSASAETNPSFLRTSAHPILQY
jgi:hypothetical protein